MNISPESKYRLQVALYLIYRANLGFPSIQGSEITLRRRVTIAVRRTALKFKNIFVKRSDRDFKCSDEYVSMLINDLNNRGDLDDTIKSLKWLIEHPEIDPRTFLGNDDRFTKNEVMKFSIFIYQKINYLKSISCPSTGVTTSQSTPSTECHAGLASNHEQKPTGNPPSPSDPSSRDPQKP